MRTINADELGRVFGLENKNDICIDSVLYLILYKKKQLQKYAKNNCKNMHEYKKYN